MDGFKNLYDIHKDLYVYGGGDYFPRFFKILRIFMKFLRFNDNMVWVIGLFSLQLTG